MPPRRPLRPPLLPSKEPAPISAARARRARRPVACIVAALGLALAAPSSLTLADPGAVRVQRSEVGRLERQLEQIDAQAERATEAYNGARWRSGRVETRIDQNTETLAETRTRLQVARRVLVARMRDMYATPPPSLVEVLVSGGSVSNAVDGVDLLDTIGEKDAGIVRGIRADVTRLQQVRVQLVQDRVEARHELREAQRRRTEVLSLLERRRRVLEGARGTLRDLVREEQARQRAEAAAEKARVQSAQRAAEAARAQVSVTPSTPSSSSSAASSSSSAAPATASAPTETGNAAVVGIAMRYLGVPYVWGGASPSGFDCSGLASYVYAQIGKSVPHYTGAIWAAFPKVALGELQPGDLVFFSSDLSHMGIYIGNGQFIHAPHTGDVVKISSLAERGSSFVGAVRP